MMQHFQNKENTYKSPDTTFKKQNLEEYITNNFLFPDNDLERICDFIRKDNGLENLIYDLKSIAKTKLDEIICMKINFYPEFQEVELMLEIEILTNLDFETANEIEDEINIKIMEIYDDSTTDKFWLYVTDKFD